ncbi:peptidyl-prolyl cis-trans isomerase PASTICCINO1 [Amaranthus tricolor]|uniref:peptidyl-prolyl cis-trans isomerase PASTICCINO1 n=1 Tax=Amaranthus tricolor TaxID=29722 RepID=UPI0025864719|nr:peptidyl-prolyl cis-trans isomerase PASTICCINO1 [Amaranthus tricolor]XP_057540359.1 peptidyl-prolyl cis-trans isomerase PASTICCINO1 [Amaranthus tricolor]
MEASEVNEQDSMLPPKKNQLSDDDKRRKKLVPGGLLKAEIRPGVGDSRPSEGDQVIYHCTVRTLDGVAVRSTRKELGGKGTPARQILGKSKLLLGLLEGIPSMQKGEISMFKMKPGMHYGEPDCPVPIEDDFPKDVDLHFEVELIDFGKAKVVSEDLGVVKKITNEGQGWESPRAPYEVKVWISAKTNDGELIWSHVDGEPFFFTLGNSEFPKGVEMGIGTMSRGEKAVIYVKNQYLTECSVIPQVLNFEEVHFEVELVHFVQVRDVLGDGRLIKRRLRDGQGEFPMDCPLQDSKLRVHYKGMLLDDKKTIFYNTRDDNDGQPLEFCSGEGLVPEGFEMSVRLMLPGELALVTCPPDYAYDKFPRPTNVPEGAYVQWEIELLGFEMPKDWTGLDFSSIMQEAENIRSTGNRLFKEAKYELAKAKYEKVLRDFNHVNPPSDEDGKEFLNTRNMLHLNVAACYLKMGECRKSIETCNKVLDANPVHVKALYRRGMAYMELAEFQEAKNDFEKMMKVDKASEPDAKAALLKLKQTEQETARKAKQQFKGLFDKRPGEIAEITTEKAKEMTNEETSVNTDREDSSNAKAKDIQEAPKSRRGSYFNIGLISLLVLLVCFILVLTYSGELLRMSSPPDAMPVPDKYDDL